MEPIHPIEKQLAKQWIKRRLSAVYPELRNDPQGLANAYEQLGLTPAEAAPGEDAPTFQMQYPDVNRDEE